LGHIIDMKKHSSLAAALVAAQKDADAVSKSSKNTFHGYKYASAEALIAEARESLSENGLALMPVCWKIVPSEVAGPSSKIVVDYLLMHEAGDTRALQFETSVIPEKGRPQDKAEAAALTLNLGYTLRGLLLLPREDETASVETRDDRPKSNAPTTMQQPTTVVAGNVPALSPAMAEGLLKLGSANNTGELTSIREWAKSNGLGEDQSFRAEFSKRYAELRASENGATK
jgi:hypothetical protein